MNQSQRTLRQKEDSSYDSESDESSNNKSHYSTTEDEEREDEVCLVFKNNEMEEENECVLFQVRKTIRDRIFPIIKFCNEAVLRQVRLNEENNILHILLANLNRLDDSLVERARFWMRYKNEIKKVITIRKTEVLNHMKEVVYNGKYMLMFIVKVYAFTHTLIRNYDT